MRKYAHALLALWLLACSSTEELASSCTLAKGQVIAGHDGLSFHAIELVPHEGHLVALWSDASGLWLRRLNVAGEPVAQAVRVAAPCVGGIDATVRGPMLAVACSRVSNAQSEGEVVVYRLEAGGTSQATTVGVSGRDGHGVSLSSEGTRLHVVFHEGSLGRHAVHWVVLEGEDIVRNDIISDVRRVGREPSSLVDQGHHYAVWSEAELDTDKTKQSSIWIKQDNAPPQRVLDTSVLSATPVLSREGEQLLLSFRDQRPRDKRSELYVARLNKSFVPLSRPVRIGRANAEGTPRLLRCGRLHAAVLPREYGGEYYVAVHELGPRLENVSGGHQYYANTREFVLASAACTGTRDDRSLSLLIGERANPAKPGVELMTLRFSCPTTP